MTHMHALMRRVQRAVSPVTIGRTTKNLYHFQPRTFPNDMDITVLHLNDNEDTVRFNLRSPLIDVNVTVVLGEIDAITEAQINETVAALERNLPDYIADYIPMSYEQHMDASWEGADPNDVTFYLFEDLVMENADAEALCHMIHPTQEHFSAERVRELWFRNHPSAEMDPSDFSKYQQIRRYVIMDGFMVGVPRELQIHTAISETASMVGFCSGRRLGHGPKPIRSWGRPQKEWMQEHGLAEEDNHYKFSVEPTEEESWTPIVDIWAIGHVSPIGVNDDMAYVGGKHLFIHDPVLMTIGTLSYDGNIFLVAQLPASTVEGDMPDWLMGSMDWFTSCHHLIPHDIDEFTPFSKRKLLEQPMM